MEQDGMLRNFPVNYQKSYDLGLGIPKLKFSGFREKRCMLQGEESGKERNGIGNFILFESIPGFSNHQMKYSYWLAVAFQKKTHNKTTNSNNKLQIPTTNNKLQQQTTNSLLTTNHITIGSTY